VFVCVCVCVCVSGLTVLLSIHPFQTTTHLLRVKQHLHAGQALKKAKTDARAALRKKNFDVRVNLCNVMRGRVNARAACACD
jgi:hypothetical protein